MAMARGTVAGDAGAERLAALEAYGILDTPAEAGFDDIVELACQICDAPTALVSIIDRERQWFKARRGFDPCQTDMSRSVCVHALAQDDILEIPDLSLDPRTHANPLVTGEHRLRFYAGAVLKTPQGVAFGSLCVIDATPRPLGLTPAQRDALRALARQVVSQLELRRAVAEREAALAVRRAAEAMLQREVDRHATLLSLQERIGAAAGDLPAILDATVAAAMRTVPGCEGAVVEMREGGTLVYAAAAGHLASFLGMRIAIGESLSGRSFSEGRTLSTGDAETDPRVNPATARKLGIRSMVVAPIARVGEVVGVLKVQSGRVNAFSTHDIRSVELLAAAVAAGFGDAAETRSIRELRANEALLRRAQEAAAIGTFSTDIARRVTVASDGFFHLLGLAPRPELSSDIWESLVVDADRERANGHLRGKDTPESAQVEYRIRRADTGELRWIARSADYVRDAAGTATSLTGIVQDISERRWEDIRRTLVLHLDDRFRACEEPSAVAAIAVEALARELEAARLSYVALDGTTSELLGFWSRAGVPAPRSLRSGIDDLGPALAADLRAGRMLVLDDLAIEPRLDSATVSAFVGAGVQALLAVPVVEGGRLLAVVVAEAEAPRRWSAHEARLTAEVAARTQEAVERARAAMALQRSETRLLLAQEVGGIGTFEVDFDHDAVEASAQMFRLFGLPERPACSTAYFTDLVLEADRDLVYTPARRRAPGAPTVAEYRIRRADDGALRWIRRVARKIESEGEGVPPRLLGVVQDITEGKLAAIALAAARDAAEAANRAKSNFLANMSHELRTPLSAVIGYSEMMEEELEDLGHRESLADLGKIKSNARHLLGLINDVLDLSKVEAGRMDVVIEDIDVPALARDVAGTVAAIVRRNGNALELRIAEDVGPLRSDGVKVRQCLLNLLGNAAKFTEAGCITLAVAREGGEVWFRVSDTGIGMTEAQLGRLFQRFSQADETTTRKFGGTGLGLALTRALADLLGGSVSVESRFGAGTTFTLRLPAPAVAADAGSGTGR